VVKQRPCKFARKGVRTSPDVKFGPNPGEDEGRTDDRSGHLIVMSASNRDGCGPVYPPMPEVGSCDHKPRSWVIKDTCWEGRAATQRGRFGPGAERDREFPSRRSRLNSSILVPRSSKRVRAPPPTCVSNAFKSQNSYPRNQGRIDQYYNAVATREGEVIQE